MKPGIGLVFLAGAFVVLSGLVQAQGPELQIVEIALNENGHATVEHLFSLDSSQGETIELNVLDSQELTVFDASGTLSFQLDGNRVRFQPRLQTRQYGVTVRYETDQLTSKQGRNWFLAIPSNRLNPADEQQAKVSFPPNAKLLSFEPTASVFLENGKIELEWVSFESNRELKASYSFEEKKPGGFPVEWLIGIVLIMALAGIGFWFWNPKKTVSFHEKKQKTGIREETAAAEPMRKELEEPKPDSRQQELLRFLNENEKKIMQEIIKEGGITQRALHVRTGLPKSTLSRAVQRLQAKELIEVRAIGNTNRIELGKAFQKP